jgi:hypothetical protein
MSITSISTPQRQKIINSMELEVSLISRLLTSLEHQIPVHEAKRRGRPRLRALPATQAS